MHIRFVWFNSFNITDSSRLWFICLCYYTAKIKKIFQCIRDSEKKEEKLGTFFDANTDKIPHKRNGQITI